MKAYSQFAEKLKEDIFHWNGWFSQGVPNSKCLLRIYANNGRIIALAQQLRESAGTSITNEAENLATLVFRMCQKDYGLISVGDFQWIEFYPKEINLTWKDHYAFVHFDWDGIKFYNPIWDNKSYEDVRKMIGLEPPKSLLKDNLNHFSDDEKRGLFDTLSRSLEKELVPAKNGGFRKAISSEFDLFCQDINGLFHFGHHEAKSVLCMASNGELLFLNEDQKF